ncbi:hypothetical protein [Haloarchaeobius sp. HME9146]|uniref:hypothetical protein n=1 Tax=Haloarchaeobius sp. HME9146 TaxID=2978732 RepID=UPI0021C0B91E|nr:hypothetical protein [Haloarchaeobius sp. HME9146]MCT9096548.1 hypothetical protein [Haloarchaeobius sp. HME9146]
MTDRDRSDRLREYVDVLRGFGLDDADICTRHGLDGDTAAEELTDRLDETLDDASEQALYDHTHDALAASHRGIDADREADDHRTSLTAVLERADWGLSVEDGDPLELTVTDPEGDSRSTTFSYPDHPLGPRNYPALVDAVEALLDGLSFVLLTEKDGRWRFVLLPDDDLASLRERYGDRIRVFRRPLLAADQPADFAEPVAEGDREGELAGLAGDAFAESFGTGPRVHRSSRPLNEESETTAEPTTVVGESVDDVFETIEDDGTAEPSSHTVSTDDGSEAGSTGGMDGSGDRLVGGNPRTTVVSGSVDEVFDEEAEEEPDAEIDGASATPTDDDSPAAEESASKTGPDPDAEKRVADLAAAAASVGPTKQPDEDDDADETDEVAAADVAEDEPAEPEVVEAAGAAESSEAAEAGEAAELSEGAKATESSDGLASNDAPDSSDSTDAPASAPAANPPESAGVDDVTDTPGDPEDAPDPDSEPADSPSISDVDLDIGDFEEPDLSEETNTDGPLAGSLGGPAIEDEGTGSGDTPSAPADAEPGDEGTNESSPGLLGRFSAWLRGLF